MRRQSISPPGFRFMVLKYSLQQCNLCYLQCAGVECDLTKHEDIAQAQAQDTPNASLISSRVQAPQVLMFLEKLFRFVDFRCQVGTASSVWMVEQHKLAMVLPDLLLRQHALAIQLRSVNGRLASDHSKSTYLSCSISAASLRFILGSKPPL